MTHKFEPSITFHVSGLDREIIVIEKIKEIVPLIVQSLKSHLLIFYDRVAFFFLTEIP